MGAPLLSGWEASVCVERHDCGLHAPLCALLLAHRTDSTASTLSASRPGVPSGAVTQSTPHEPCCSLSRSPAKLPRAPALSPSAPSTEGSHRPPQSPLPTRPRRVLSTSGDFLASLKSEGALRPFPSPNKAVRVLDRSAGRPPAGRPHAEGFWGDGEDGVRMAEIRLEDVAENGGRGWEGAAWGSSEGESERDYLNGTRAAECTHVGMFPHAPAIGREALGEEMSAHGGVRGDVGEIRKEEGGGSLWDAMRCRGLLWVRCRRGDARWGAGEGGGGGRKAGREGGAALAVQAAGAAMGRLREVVADIGHAQYVVPRYGVLVLLPSVVTVLPFSVSQTHRIVTLSTLIAVWLWLSDNVYSTTYLCFRPGDAGFKLAKRNLVMADLTEIERKRAQIIARNRERLRGQICQSGRRRPGWHLIG